MKKVLVEGPPDLVLVRALGFTKKRSSKRDGKGEVCNYLRKNSNLLALVDEDPDSQVSRYLKGLPQTALDFNLLEYKDLKNNNKIIALRPRLEEWILQVVKEAKIDLQKQFKLPDTPKDLHDALPQKLAEFERLISNLIAIQNPAILFLQKQLEQTA